MNDTAHALSASRTLWELVARLGRPHPTARSSSRATAPSFGALRDRAERGGGGPYDMGVRPGTVVAWQLPTRIETALLSFALARLGAVQSPVIPFYRDREVGFALRESKAEYFAVPGEWRGFDHTGMARRLGAKGVFEAYRRVAGRRSRRAARAARRGHLGPLDLLDLGDYVRPQGGPALRSLADRGRLVSRPRAAGPSAADVGSMAFPYAHIAGPDYTVMLLLYGFPAA